MALDSPNGYKPTISTSPPLNHLKTSTVTFSTPSFREGSTPLHVLPEANEERGLNGNNPVDGMRRSPSPLSANQDLELSDMTPNDPADDAPVHGFTDDFKRGRAVSLTGRASLDADIETNGNALEEGKRLAYEEFIRKSAVNVILIGLWYLFSITISIYNKWMFSQGNLDFPFPLFTTSLHMVVQFTLSSLVILMIPRLRPGVSTINHHFSDSSSPPRTESPDPAAPVMTPRFYLTRIAPCATFTGLDIGLGNTSLKFITLTFFTMCKSSVLGFVLLFAIIFRLEKPSWKLGGIILVMTAGVVMMVAGETAFNIVGFALLMTASFSSGLRWSLTQILLRRTPATSNPFASLFFLTPIMFLVLLVIAFPAEGLGPLIAGFEKLSESKGLLMGILILLFPGVLAFLMTASEFALLQRTSVVTLSVCGIFKEVITIAAASFVFGDAPLTPINIAGLLITICAIAAYNYIRIKKMKRKVMRQASEVLEENAPMLASEPRADFAQGAERAGRMSTSDMIRHSLSQPTHDSRDRSSSASGPLAPNSRGRSVSLTGSLLSGQRGRSISLTNGTTSLLSKKPTNMS